MEKEQMARELIKKHLHTVREEEVLGYLEEYSSLVDSGVIEGERLNLLWNLLNISGIKMREFQKGMQEEKVSYASIYKACLNYKPNEEE